MSASSPEEQPSTARRSLLALAGLVGSAGLTFAALLIVVRTLEISEYGLFALAFAVNQLAFVAADAGLASSAARALAAATSDADRARIAASALGVKVVVAVGVGIVLAALAPLVARAFGEPDLAPVLRIMAIALAAQSVFMLFRHGLNALGAARSLLGLVLGESALEAAAVVALAVATGTAAGATAGRAIGWTVGIAMGFWLLRRRLGRLARPSPAVVRALAAYGLTLALAEGAFLLFTQIDVLLIGALLSATDVATFEAPARLLVVAGFLGSAVALSVAPRLARAPARAGRALLVRAVRVVSVVQGAMLLGWLALVAPNATLIFGDGYEASADILLALSPYLLLAGAAPLLSFAASYTGAGRQVVVASCAALLLNAAIDLVFLRTEGVVVAALATDLAFALFVAVMLRGCARRFGFALTGAAAGAARLGGALALPAGAVLALGTVSPLAAAAAVVPALVAYVGGLRVVGLVPAGAEDLWAWSEALRPGRA